jgi:hypothetical protein
MAVGDLTKENLSENLNTKFRLPLPDEKFIELELVKVLEHNSSPQHESFSIYFRGSKEFFLPQGTYPLEHERLGTVEIFLVPTGQDQDGFSYEAVFNRLLEGE